MWVVRFPGVGVIGACVLETELRSLQEQSSLLTMEPSLQVPRPLSTPPSPPRTSHDLRPETCNEYILDPHV